MLSFRYRLFAALVLGLALALPAVAAPAPVEGPAGPFEKYLPDSADGVISFNVRQFLDSELIKKAGLDKLLAADESQNILKALGLDPLKDIERVIISNDKTNSDPYFIVQGKFEPAKLAAAAELAAKDKKEILKVHQCEHGKVYEITKLDELVKVPSQAAGQVNGLLKDRSLFGVIADKGNIVVVGTRESAELVLAKAAGKKTTKLTNQELTGLIAKIDPKQTIAIAVPAPEANLKSVTGGITLTKDLKVDVTLTATDAGAAKELNKAVGEQLQMVQDGAGLLVLGQKELAPLVDILGGFKHEAKDNTVGITTDIKGETLEKLFKALAELAKNQKFQ
jgi:hypothetical protein